MKLRKSTRAWLAVFGVAAVAYFLLRRFGGESGCARAVAWTAAACAAVVLLVRLGVAAFRHIVRRLALRLAFSYFLIGVVPIPLLAALLFATAYLIAHQYMANRLRREITEVGEAAVRGGEKLPEVRAGPDGRIARSDAPFLSAGDPAPWLEALERPGFLVSPGAIWLAVPTAPRSAALLRLTDPAAPWLQRLADRTDYTVGVEHGESAKEQGVSVRIDPERRNASANVRSMTADFHPRAHPEEGRGLVRSEWVHAFYLETGLNAVAEKAETGENVAVLAAKTSPAVLFDQLFSQGVPEFRRIFRIVFLSVAFALLLVYLVALAIAFVLVGSIARNVNRLTRAAEAVGRGDFSVRVNSRSRDQIGDLARSFDGMAASIQRLLLETAAKERLESELAVARTIQRKLLPPLEATRPGLSMLAHFEPVAEIGGDYYDVIPLTGDRTALALGDVSGHGLPTGLLVAMAKAALSTLLEAGHGGAELFGRLNELIHRSTDPRHYMTLTLLDYDPASRRGRLTNAGQLAPYRVRRGGAVESIPLPSFPLGLFPDRAFPECAVALDPGDVLVFVTDGFIEATDANDDPFGFERFEEVLRAASGGGAVAIRDALLSAVRGHTGGRPPDDDRTLMVVTVE